MKLLAINGSHKKSDGINQLFIDHLFNGASQAGANCETIRLSKMKINPCISCNKCQKQSDYSCIYDDKDDFVKIISKIKESDIIIFSSPIYIFQMSGLFKIFFDRFYSRGKSGIKIITKSHLLFHDTENNLFRKPFISIIVSDNLEKESTRNLEEYFKIYSRYFDAPRIATITRNGCFIFKEDKSKNKFSKKINEVLSNFELAGKTIVLHNSIPKTIIKKISQNIMPIPPLVFNILKRLRFGRDILIDRINT